jgi:hypothetical protein
VKKIMLILIAITSFSVSFSNSEYPDLQHNKAINELLLKYEATKDLQKKQFYLIAAAEQHSGLANKILAQEINIPDSQKIKYYLQVAKYGYPSQSYKAIADIYEQGLGIKKDDFLAECYKNLSQNTPNQSLIKACRSRYQMNFEIKTNLGLQSLYEIKQQASLDYTSLCIDSTNNNLLNPSIDKYERHILMQKICNKNVIPNNKNYIQNNDLVYKDNKILKKTAKGYVPYNKKIADGLVVYKPNPPLSLYIAKDNELVPAQDGDQVIKNHHTYIVKDNRLIKYHI